MVYLQLIWVCSDLFLSSSHAQNVCSGVSGVRGGVRRSVGV